MSAVGRNVCTCGTYIASTVDLHVCVRQGIVIVFSEARAHEVRAGKRERAASSPYIIGRGSGPGTETRAPASPSRQLVATTAGPGASPLTLPALHVLEQITWRTQLVLPTATNPTYTLY